MANDPHRLPNLTEKRMRFMRNKHTIDTMRLDASLAAFGQDGKSLSHLQASIDHLQAIVLDAEIPVAAERHLLQQLQVINEVLARVIQRHENH